MQVHHRDDLSAGWVASTYGCLVSAKDLSKLLSFASPSALRRAHATGRLAIPLFTVPGRRGWFAHAGDISAYLRAQGVEAATEGEVAMT